VAKGQVRQDGLGLLLLPWPSKRDRQSGYGKLHEGNTVFFSVASYTCIVKRDHPEGAGFFL
jgi:hypothetical protein